MDKIGGDLAERILDFVDDWTVIYLVRTLYLNRLRWLAENKPLVFLRGGHWNTSPLYCKYIDWSKVFKPMIDDKDCLTPIVGPKFHKYVDSPELLEYLEEHGYIYNNLVSLHAAQRSDMGMIEYLVKRGFTLSKSLATGPLYSDNADFLVEILARKFGVLCDHFNDYVYYHDAVTCLLYLKKIKHLTFVGAVRKAIAYSAPKILQMLKEKKLKGIGDANNLKLMDGKKEFPNKRRRRAKCLGIMLEENPTVDILTSPQFAAYGTPELYQEAKNKLGDFDYNIKRDIQNLAIYCGNVVLIRFLSTEIDMDWFPLLGGISQPYIRLKPPKEIGLITALDYCRNLREEPITKLLCVNSEKVIRKLCERGIMDNRMTEECPRYALNERLMNSLVALIDYGFPITDYMRKDIATRAITNTRYAPNVAVLKALWKRDTGLSDEKVEAVVDCFIRGHPCII